MPLEITTSDLKALMDRGEDLFLLDVREPSEVAVARFKGAHTISLSQLLENLSKLPEQGRIIVICHHGVRSLRAASFLKQQGYNTLSLKGGIDAWARDVDPTVALY
jgi:rhodanese-related sulfurtransferase